MYPSSSLSPSPWYQTVRESPVSSLDLAEFETKRLQSNFVKYPSKSPLVREPKVTFQNPDLSRQPNSLEMAPRRIKVRQRLRDSSSFELSVTVPIYESINVLENQRESRGTCKCVKNVDGVRSRRRSTTRTDSPPHWPKLDDRPFSSASSIRHFSRCHLGTPRDSDKVNIHENWWRDAKVGSWLEERRTQAGEDRSGLDRSIGRTGDRLGSWRPATEEHGRVYKRALTGNPRWLLSRTMQKRHTKSSSWKQKSAVRGRRRDDKSRLWEARESPGKPATALDGRRDHTLTSTPTFRLPLAPI